jgi:hypothetical protein
MPEITEPQLFQPTYEVYPYEERIPYVIIDFFTDYKLGEIVYIMTQKKPVNTVYPKRVFRSQRELLKTCSPPGERHVQKKELWIW